MANPEHLEILKQGVAQWNKWRGEHPDVTPDLSEADLIGADLREARLSRANLLGADLSKADLREANLSGADLSGAFMSGANLFRADLTMSPLVRANLEGADLSEAKLRMANLSHSNLNGAGFTAARAGGTHFADVDLSTTMGLESVVHVGPSTIGIDTIYKSRGKIPEVFLRGCGLQDWEIELVKLYQADLGAADLTTILYRVSELRSGAPVRYSSCFISYSTKDQEFAERLYADLQAKGVRCWFAPEEMKAGRKVHEQIDEAIRLHDRLLLILSEHSMKSEWVNTEIAKASKREVKDGKRVLFPVRLVGFEVLRDWECFDADTGKDSAREIREYFIPDFSNWKEHDSYRVAFDRLVKDLKQSA